MAILVIMHILRYSHTEPSWLVPDFVLLPVLQMDQLSCNGDKKLQPDRSQAIRERLRGKGLPTGKCRVSVRIGA